MTVALKNFNSKIPSKNSTHTDDEYWPDCVGCVPEGLIPSATMQGQEVRAKWNGPIRRPIPTIPWTMTKDGFNLAHCVLCI